LNKRYYVVKKKIKNKNMVWFMVFNTTFNNISYISWWSVLLVEETGVPGENHRPVADKLYHIMLIQIHHINQECSVEYLK
jgi:hypothetical protein